MSSIPRKMQVLKSLEIPGFVQHDGRTATIRKDGWELKLTLLEKTVAWATKNKGKTYDWKTSEEVPAEIKEFIEDAEIKFSAALREVFEKEGSFEEAAETEIEEPAQVDSIPEEVPENGWKEGGYQAAKEATCEKKDSTAPKTDWKRLPDRMIRKEAEQMVVEQVTGRQVVPLDMRMKQIVDLSIEDITNFINPKATVQEAGMFLKLCQARGLNPFLGEAHLIKYSEGEAAQFVTGKEAFTRRAEVNPHVVGWKAGIIVRLKAGKDNISGPIEKREGSFKLPEEELLGGWAEIHRDDSKFPFIYEVTLEEYIGKKRDGTITKMWKEKPCTMIRKDAVVGGLREAAPSEFSGMYDAAEMGGEAIEAVYEVVD